MPPKRKMTIYLTEDEHKALEEWAIAEKRAVSNLAVTIITKALEERYQQINSPNKVSDRSKVES